MRYLAAIQHNVSQRKTGVIITLTALMPAMKHRVRVSHVQIRLNYVMVFMIVLMDQMNQAATIVMTDHFHAMTVPKNTMNRKHDKSGDVIPSQKNVMVLDIVLKQ